MRRDSGAPTAKSKMSMKNLGTLLLCVVAPCATISHSQSAMRGHEPASQFDLVGHALDL